jgi:uncharacterized protein (DUF58 family)
MFASADSNITEQLGLDAGLLAEVKRIQLRSRRSVSSDMIGRYRSAFRGSGIVFSDLREYQPGDEIKHIHWKATAKSPAKVYVKSHEEDRELRVMILLDISASVAAGVMHQKRQRAVQFSALIASLAQGCGDSVGLSLFSDEVHKFMPPKRSRSNFQGILYALAAEAKPKGRTKLAVALEHLLTHQKRPAIVFLISDFLDRDYTEQLKEVSAKHDLIGVFNAEGGELPDVGLVQYQDAETGEKFLLDTSAKKTRKFLAEQDAKRITALGNEFRSIGADLIELTDNPLKPLRQLMAKRQARFR